jgi:hypothetical protein
MSTRPADRPQRSLDERENQRAVERIEDAERTASTCACGSHMMAVSHGDVIWLECAAHDQERTGLAGLVARLTAFTHTRRMIMRVPVAD